MRRSHEPCTETPVLETKLNARKGGCGTFVTCILAVDGPVCQIQLFAPPQVLVSHLRRFFSMNWLGERYTATFDEPTGYTDNFA